MDESEKRRERLRAMRIEAESQASIPHPSPSHFPSTPAPPPPPPPHFFNPLAHPPPPAGEASPSTPRFDFYTDPMSAFAGSKRKSGSGGGSHGRGGYNQQESFSSPIPTSSPMSLHHTSAGSMNYPISSPSHQFHVNQSHDLSPNVPQSDSWISQGPFASPFSVSGSVPVMNAGGWNKSGGSSGHGFPPISSRGGFISPGSGRGSSPHFLPGRGNIWQSGGSPSPGRSGGWGSSEHGPGRSGGWGPHEHGPGRSGGRGRGFSEHGSDCQKPEYFNRKAMVEDPWRELKPIVGNILVPLGGPGFWLPNSLRPKKARVEESGNEVSSQKAKFGSGNEFSSQSSLAECLAQAFDEAVNEANA